MTITFVCALWWRVVKVCVDGEDPRPAIVKDDCTDINSTDCTFK